MGVGRERARDRALTGRPSVRCLGQHPVVLGEIDRRLRQTNLRRIARWWINKSIGCAESRHYIFVSGGSGSGADGDVGDLALGEAHTFGQDDSEVVEQRGLHGIGLRHAARSDLTVRGGAGSYG